MRVVTFWNRHPWAPAPLSMYSSYLDAVRDALEQEPNEWGFKSNAGYREVLEHVTADYAEQFLYWSRVALPDLDIDVVRDLCDMNDSIGLPVRSIIPGLGVYSPSNMRYLCHAIKVWQHIESLGLQEVDIVEIGGGYGGLALYVWGLQRYFRSVMTYMVVDLPEVAALTKRVFNAWGLPWRFHAYSLTNPATNGPFVYSKFAVSAYAFSEFDQATRDYYAKRILRHCRHGLMIWNFPEPIKGEDGRMFGGPVYPFVEHPITRTPDKPDLYPGHEQVTW